MRSHCLIVRHTALHDTGQPGWKLGADGKIEMKDGNPVYINAAGAEMVIEQNTISRLNGESKTHRERAERAEAALQPFKDAGLTDATKAKEALELVGKLDQKKLIDAGEVEKVREEVAKGYTAQIAERDAKIAGQTETISSMRLKQAFSGSKFIQERVAVPVEMFEATFGRNFKIEGDQVIPYGADGNQIYSRKSLGRVADVDEALEIILESYPHKDTVLKAPNNSGSGNSGDGGYRGNGNRMRRADFEKLPPNDQQQIALKKEVQIVD